MTPDDHELIYDWNSVEKVAPLSPKRRIQFLDETLRDGIQSPSVVDPSIDDKLRLVDLANDLGIDTMDIGLPGAGKRAVEDVTTHRRAHPRRTSCAVKASCAARTHLNDVQADRRHLAEGRHRDRGAVLHRQLADPPVRRGLGPRADDEAVGRRDRSRPQVQPAGRLRHRGHHALAPRGARRSCSRTRSSTARSA